MTGQHGCRALGAIEGTMQGLRPGSRQQWPVWCSPRQVCEASPEYAQLEERAWQLLEAGDVSSHGAGQFAATGEGRCGA